MPGQRLPHHIAFIMDGNRRWARKHQLPTFWGHRRGIHALLEVVRNALRLHIPYITVFAFSTENWKRTDTEIRYLMNLFYRSMIYFQKWIAKHSIQVNFIGDRTALSPALQEEMAKLEKFSESNRALTLTIAINYGSRDEIVRAIQKLDLNDLKFIDWKLLYNHLDTHTLPDVDLMVRTSGEQRLSNFLLLQSAYAEIIFSEKLWPEYTENDFLEALEIYQQRKRNFGK